MFKPSSLRVRKSTPIGCSIAPSEKPLKKKWDSKSNNKYTILSLRFYPPNLRIIRRYKLKWKRMLRMSHPAHLSPPCRRQNQSKARGPHQNKLRTKASDCLSTDCSRRDLIRVCEYRRRISLKSIRISWRRRIPRDLIDSTINSSIHIRPRIQRGNTATLLFLILILTGTKVLPSFKIRSKNLILDIGMSSRNFSTKNMRKWWAKSNSMTKYWPPPKSQIWVNKAS